MNRYEEYETNVQEAQERYDRLKGVGASFSEYQGYTRADAISDEIEFWQDELDKIGEEMLSIQEKLSSEYGYKRLPPTLAEIIMQGYYDNLPKEFKGQPIKVDSDKGYEIFPVNRIPLYSKDGTLIANNYDRVVIGHYGAFIEFSPQNLNKKDVKVKEGQDYRLTNPRYTDKVKYAWLTTNDKSDCKIYDQKKSVTYADYRPNKLYISPYEVMSQREIAERSLSLKVSREKGEER